MIIKKMVDYMIYQENSLNVTKIGKHFSLSYLYFSIHSFFITMIILFIFNNFGVIIPGLKYHFNFTSLADWIGFFTYPFMHRDLNHLFTNMIFLFFIMLFIYFYFSKMKIKNGLSWIVFIFAFTSYVILPFAVFVESYYMNNIYKGNLPMILRFSEGSIIGFSAVVSAFFGFLTCLIVSFKTPWFFNLVRNENSSWPKSIFLHVLLLVISLAFLAGLAEIFANFVLYLIYLGFVREEISYTVQNLGISFVAHISGFVSGILIYHLFFSKFLKKLREVQE